MSRTRTRFTVLSAALIGALLATATPALAVEGDTVYLVEDDDYTLRIVETSDAQMWGVEVTNHTAAPIEFGLGATTHNPTDIEFLWESPWLYFGEESAEVVQPGQTYEHFLPAWPGADLVFYRDIRAARTEIGRYRAPGDFLPFIVSGTEETGLVLQWGPALQVGSGTARAGEVVRLTADWMYMPSAEIYLLSEQEAIDGFGQGEFTEWGAWSVPDARAPLATVPVVGDRLEVDVVLPAGLAPGPYAVIAVDPETGAGIAGPSQTSFITGGEDPSARNLVIEAGPPRGSVDVSPSPVQVTPTDQFGNSPVSFTLPNVTTPGQISVTTSEAGPAPSGFTLNGTTYYELEVTAGFDGRATVCIAYDTSGWVEADGLWQSLALFHFDDPAWQDITTSVAFGEVCGETDGFSPFAIGIPDAPPVWPFEGFLAPLSNTALNTDFAGTIVPFRFRLGGDLGLGVLDGTPTSQKVNCTTRAPIGPAQAAQSAIRAELTYARTSQTYWYFWDTSASWANTCRTFTMTLDDGTSHSATFSFKKFSLGKLIRAAIKAF